MHPRTPIRILFEFDKIIRLVGDRLASARGEDFKIKW